MPPALMPAGHVKKFTTGSTLQTEQLTGLQLHLHYYSVLKTQTHKISCICKI